MKVVLSELMPSPGSRHKKKRLGRGESSNLGKTCGRGGKGQTARTGGKVAIHFEGGQMPFYRRIPKIGFRCRKRVLGKNCYSLVTLSDLESFDAGSLVTPDSLIKSGKRLRGAGFKVVANGSLTKPLSVRLHAASSVAREKIAAVGGNFEEA